MRATQSVALPPMTGGTYMFLTFVLLVNNFHYWLAGSKNTTYVIKYFMLYKRNDSVMKTIVLYIKYK